MAAIVFFTMNDVVTQGWLEAWNRWDAGWYYQIWKDGWGHDPHTLVFMPLFAWVAGGLADRTTASFALAALLINLPCFTLAGVIAAEYLGRRFEVSWWGIFLFHLCAPAGFFAFVPYSDALFYLLFWLAIVILESPPPTWRERLAQKSLMLLLPFARLTGFALVIWALFRRWSALAVLVSFALVCWINHRITGDAFYFLHTQVEFAMPDGWFADGLAAAVSECLTPPLNPNFRLDWMTTALLPVLSTMLIVLALFWYAFKRQWFFVATIFAVAFFSRNQTFWRSVVRYDLPLVPLLAVPWLAWTRRGAAAGAGGGFRSSLALAAIGALLAIGLALELGLGRRFHLGFWAF